MPNVHMLYGQNFKTSKPKSASYGQAMLNPASGFPQKLLGNMRTQWVSTRQRQQLQHPDSEIAEHQPIRSELRSLEKSLAIYVCSMHQMVH